MLKITTKINTLYITEEQNVLVFEKINSIKNKQAKNLNISDILLHTKEPLQFNNEVGCDWSYFVGYFLGNGYCGQTKSGPCIEISMPNDYFIINKIEKEFKKLFGKKYHAKPRIDQKMHRINCYKQYAFNELTKLKKPNKPIHIPNFILTSCEKNRLAFLAGLLDADGCVTVRPLNLLTSKYTDFTHEVSSLYSSLGIPTITRKCGKMNKINVTGSYFYKKCINELSTFSEKLKNINLNFNNVKSSKLITFPRKLFSNPRDVMESRSRASFEKVITKYQDVNIPINILKIQRIDPSLTPKNNLSHFCYLVEK